MWTRELRIKTKTAERRMGSQSERMGTMDTSLVSGCDVVSDIAKTISVIIQFPVPIWT
jgi:hypothetical protein